MDHENCGRSSRTASNADIASLADLQDFFARLPNGDKQFVSLPHTAHSLDLRLNRAQFWHAVQAFPSLPPPAA